MLVNDRDTVQPHLLGDIARMRRWAQEQRFASELKALHRPRLWRSLAAAIGDWLLIFAAFGAVVIGGVIVIPVALVLIGNRQRALGNLLHDASHGSFGGSRRQASLLAQCLLFLPLCTDRTLYRREHLAHQPGRRGLRGAFAASILHRLRRSRRRGLSARAGCVRSHLNIGL